MSLTIGNKYVCVPFMVFFFLLLSGHGEATMLPEELKRQYPPGKQPCFPSNSKDSIYQMAICPNITRSLGGARKDANSKVIHQVAMGGFVAGVLMLGPWDT